MQYASLFHRGERHVIPSSDQGAASLSSTATLDDSLSDMYRSPPRPLPYDADPRYFRLQQDGQVSRREKGSSHSQEETEPLQRSFNDPESLSDVNKWSLPTFEEGSKEFNKSSVEFSTAKMTSGDAHSYYYSEDEDVCPTCLEGKFFIALCSTSLDVTSSLMHAVCTEPYKKSSSTPLVPPSGSVI